MGRVEGLLPAVSKEDTELNHRIVIMEEIESSGKRVDHSRFTAKN